MTGNRDRGRRAPVRSGLPTGRNRILFVDWAGVLSAAPFWHSILDQPGHPFRPQLTGSTSRLFADAELVDAWMRGHLTSADIVRGLGDRLGGEATAKDLLRRLYADCRTMPIDSCLAEELRRVGTQARVVIATDNMDCFAQSVPFRSDLSFAAEILVSCSLGVLKSENPQRFFGPCLDRHGSTFAEATLLDDNARNCAAFTNAGGTAFQARDAPEAVDVIRRELTSRHHR